MKIINAWICQINQDSAIPVFGDIEISDGKITSIVKREFKDGNLVSSQTKNDIDARGRLVTIPLVNFHDHFYSRLAKGLPIKGDMSNFKNILKNLWWKLDIKLDEDMIKASAQMATLESIRQGVTYIFDHHSSPNSADGSLKIIANIISEVGLNAVLCFETTDRNGYELASEGIDENRAFLVDQTSENVKGMLGLHASFTLSDESLLIASNLLKDFDTGIHIHLCEDEIDVEESIKQFNLSPVERLNQYNLLNDKSILSHGIHLNDGDYETLSDIGCAIAYNPESNMNNSVGLPAFDIPSGIKLISGTDGMHSNPGRSLKQIFLLARHSGYSFDQSFGLVQRIYFNQIDFVKRYFPFFTSLNEGDRADLIIWDYIPPTPLSYQNYWGHYIYGALERPIHSVVNKGEVLMNSFRMNLDEDTYTSNIVKHGHRLYNKFI